MVENKEKNFISAVVYVNNNQDTLMNLLNKINNFLEENFNKYEIICVNDASRDNSVKIIKKFTKEVKNQKLSLINMSNYHGLELSMGAGVDLAIGDFVYEFDNIYDDFDIKVIKEVYDKCLQGYDIVSASSKSCKTSSSNLFYKIFNKSAGLEYKLQTETFRILSRRAINRVNSINNHISYRKAVYANCGLKMLNIKYNPINNVKRIISKDYHSNRKTTAVNSIILFTNVGYKFSLLMSVLTLLSTLFVFIYTIVIFFSKNPVQGWTTTMLFLSFGFFGIFALMTIAIKYLDIIINLLFKNKIYLIESIEKLN